MTDEDFEQLTADVLDGRRIDWPGLAGDTDAATVRRVASLRRLEHLMIGSKERPVARLETPSSQPREQWDGFTLIEPIGRGGFGEVWRAYDPQLDRDVALKIVPAEDDEEARAVLQEGRLLARIHHPNVATVFGATRGDGEVGVAMEFVPGADLESRLGQDGPMRPRDVVDVGLQLARALEAVHRAGVLHRDVKASNVKRTPEGRVILLDFGSGRELRTHVTGPVEESGTPLYLAPEILNGEPATVQSDLYSLGVLLFRLLSGRYPVEADSIDALREAHRRRPASRVTVPNSPRRLARFLAHVLAADPARRPATAASAAAMLDRRRTGLGLVTGIAAALVLAVMAAGARSMWPPTSPSRSHTTRRIDSPVASAYTGIPSRNGRWLPFVDRRDGALALLDVESGAVTTLTSGRESAGGRAGASVASADGARIAYAWHLRDCDCEELRILDVATRHATMVWRGEPAITFQPTDWSADGRSVAVSVTHPDKASDLFIVDPPAKPRLVAQGSARHGTFDPGDRYLAFENSDSRSAGPHLWLADIRTGALTQVNAGGEGSAPFWIGDTLAFVSSRSGGTALWAVAFDRQAGRTRGDPRRVIADLSLMRPLSATLDGALLYQRSARQLRSLWISVTESRPRITRHGSIFLAGR